jgi:hypothetical protein
MGGVWLLRFAPLIAATQACASDAVRFGRTFTTLSEREGADFDAFAARIVPTDDTPGAHEAGAIHFADLALETFLDELLPIVRDGLSAMNQRIADTFEGIGTFVELFEGQQDKIITAVEQEEANFFFFARVLVLMSLMAEPEYAGNVDRVGWQLIGRGNDAVFQPPFGFYDRDEHAAPTTGAGE